MDIGGEILCGISDVLRLKVLVTDDTRYLVSQFTLLANTKKGNKPDFHGAAGGDHAKSLYDHFFAKVKELYVAEKVKDGVFQAMMDVGLVNDGPVSEKWWWLKVSTRDFSDKRLIWQGRSHWN